MATVAEHTTLAVLPLAISFVTVAMVSISKFAASVQPVILVQLTIWAVRILTKDGIIGLVVALDSARAMPNALNVLTLLARFR